MKRRKINTPKDLHISYMCEYIDDYHDICKYAKELIGIGYKSKGLLKLSEIAKNKDIKNFDKNYSDFINDFDQFKLLKTVLFERKQFRDAIVESKSVTEMNASKAKDELNSLIIELL